MKTFRLISAAVSFLLFSCSNNAKDAKSLTAREVADTSRKDTTASQKAPDNKKWVADDFPVTNEMFAQQNNTTSSSFKKISGQTHSLDKAWFGNDSLKQTIVYELYTDYHRMAVYWFYNQNIPKDLLDKIELHTKEGELAPQAQKLKDFPGFVHQAAKTNARYFKTNKGFALGDFKQKVIDVYAKPDTQMMKNGFEILEWSFVGDLLYNDKGDLKEKSLAEDSYGHRVTMYFKEGKLFGLILYNDIP